jgi:hypothetical protein
MTTGCAATREYDDVLHNRNTCNSCEGSDGHLLREMASGCNPCKDAGPCGCATPAATCGCGTAPGSTDAFPAGAKPGEAWCRVVIPARYETIREPVQTACASVERDWVPPVTRLVLRPVLVAEACDEVIRTPGATRLDVMCAEGCPARTETRMVTEQGPCGCTTRCETVRIPATTCQTTREVCIQAPGRHEVHTPAQYVQEPCLVEVSPGRWVDRPRPAVVEMRTRVVCTSPERIEWRRNPSCEVPVVPSNSPCLPASKK